MAFPAFLDTCTIFGSVINDLILWLAEGGAFRPLWSEGVMKELQENLVEKGVDSDLAEKRVQQMRTFFPDAMVDGYEELIDRMTCHSKDRHVLAAAVRANAEVLVTFNLKDFPDECVESYEIEVVHPDDFLLDQLDLYPSLVVRTLRRLVELYQNPSITMEDLLEMLIRSGVPNFVDEVRRHL
ncbi:MAG: PIN domain-containing protein [Pseudolysinimonas sp.]|uniref:PIN domain-containing protein n=1 Tax=Pseudolysinimonas sp. TaxID=2680009 RepID=UPI0032670ECE